MDRKSAEAFELRELGISRDVLAFEKREYKLWVDGPKDKYYRQWSSTNQNSAREYTARIASDGQNVAAVKRAEELQRDLKSRHPSFIKPTGLPTHFCKENLTPSEWKMVLEDEKGKDHLVLYLGRKNGLSGGWRGFAIDHNLEDGDVLVFELSQPARFKIYDEVIGVPVPRRARKWYILILKSKSRLVTKK